MICELGNLQGKLAQEIEGFYPKMLIEVTNLNDNF